MARRTPSTHVTYYIENRIRNKMLSDDGKLLFNPGVTALVLQVGKYFRITHTFPELLLMLNNL